MTERRVSNWNVPNALTTLRIAMVPFFGWALLVDDGGSVLWRLAACVLFMLAAVTDKIDGDLARKHDLVTDFGKIADPIADKALTGMAFVGLSIVGDLWWWVTVLVLVREWGVTVLRFAMIRHGVVIAASPGGKLKTLLQTIALTLMVLPLRLLEGGWGVAGEALWWVAVVTMAAAVLVTVVTGADYVAKAVTHRREARQPLPHVPE